MSDELYYIVAGTLSLPDVKKEVGPGRWLGAIALFSHADRPTIRAIAKTECTAMVLSGKAALAALIQEPQLGIPLLRVATVTALQDAPFQIRFYNSTRQGLRA